MVEHERMNHEKKKELEKKIPSRKKAEPLYDQLKAADEGIADLIGEPSVDRHAVLLAGAHSDEQRANLVMHLQQSYGNAYVQRLLNSRAVQAKLTVSQPGDVYEQEADRVADMVTKAETSEIKRQTEEEEEEEGLQMQRQAEEEEEEEQEEEVQTQLAEGQPDTVSENIEARIKNARGSGHPLSDNVREPMEQAFETDFSDVRVHTDSEANLLSQQLSARAFTTARDIFFRQGEYSPGSDTGKKLIAHELTHVVQQSSKAVSLDDNAFEQEAVQTEIARVTDGKIQRLKKYKLDKSGAVIANQPPEIINIGTLNYEGLIHWQREYNTPPDKRPNIVFEAGDIDRINQRIAEIEEPGIEDVWCMESQVKVAKPAQKLIHKGVSSCLTITCELEDGTRVGAHESLGLHVPNGVIGGLNERIQQQEKQKVSKVYSKGVIEGWLFDPGSDRIIGDVEIFEMQEKDPDFKPDKYKPIIDNIAEFNTWLGGKLNASEVENPKTQQGDITFEPVRIRTTSELIQQFESYTRAW